MFSCKKSLLLMGTIFFYLEFLSILWNKLNKNLPTHAIASFISDNIYYYACWVTGTFFMEAKEKNKMFYRPKPIFKKKVIIFYSLSDFGFLFLHFGFHISKIKRNLLKLIIQLELQKWHKEISSYKILICLDK